MLLRDNTNYGFINHYLKRSLFKRKLYRTGLMEFLDLITPEDTTLKTEERHIVVQAWFREHIKLEFNDFILGFHENNNLI